MNTKKIILPLVALFLLAGCNSGSKKTSKKSGTSQSPTPSEQKIPSYDGLPDYGEYEGTPGVGENHIQSISASPNKTHLAYVGDVFTIDSSVSPSSIPEEEKVFSYTSSNESIASVKILDEGPDGEVTCLSPGKTTITVYSFEKRFKREIVLTVYEKSDSTDFYQVGTNANNDKKKFGWVDKRYFDGDSAGVTQLGRNFWKFLRSQPSKIATYGGALAFGSANAPEGSFELSTVFQYPVESVILNCSSAPETDPSTGINTSYGSSTIDSWIGENHFDITINGTKYSPTSAIHTARGTDDATCSDHIIDCKNMSGEFHVKLGASAGYIRIKSIVINYANRVFPSGNESTANINFDEASFTTTPSSSFKANTCKDANNLVNVALSYMKEKDAAVENHYAMRGNSTLIITPVDKTKTIKSVDATFAQYTLPEDEVDKDGKVIKEAGTVIINNITTRESYTNADAILDNFPSKENNVKLTNLNLGTNWVEIKNAQTQTSGYLLGLVSLKVELTDAVTPASFSKMEIEGHVLQDTYDYESTTYRDTFKDRGCAVNAYFTNPNLMPIMLNSNDLNFKTVKDSLSWNALSLGDTSVSGTSKYGALTYEGITVQQHENKQWKKATSVGEGKYLIVSRETHKCFSGIGTNTQMQNGTTDFVVSLNTDNMIDGSYQIDYSYFTFTSTTSNHFRADSRSEYFINGLTSSGKISFSYSSNVSLFLVQNEGGFDIHYSQNKKQDDGTYVTYEYVFGLTSSGYFSFVDVTSEASQLPEPVDFYRLA